MRCLTVSSLREKVTRKDSGTDARALDWRSEAKGRFNTKNQCERSREMRIQKAMKWEEILRKENEGFCTNRQKL
jgi:hypothetical protein